MNSNKTMDELNSIIDTIRHARAICNDSQVSLYLTRAIDRLSKIIEVHEDNKQKNTEW